MKINLTYVNAINQQQVNEVVNALTELKFNEHEKLLFVTVNVEIEGEYVSIVTRAEYKNKWGGISTSTITSLRSKRIDYLIKYTIARFNLWISKGVHLFLPPIKFYDFIKEDGSVIGAFNGKGHNYEPVE